MTTSKQNVLDFIEQYPELFADDEREDIVWYIETIGEELFLPSIIRQLYDKFHITPDQDNIYLGFIDLLSSVHDISNLNILEVGGGKFPCLGRRISLLQDEGSITVYDPLMSIYEEENSHLTLKRKLFLPNTEIGNTDLMIGFMPCKGAESLLESAIKNEVDFMIALCEGGDHSAAMCDYYDSVQYWIDSMIYKAGRGVEDHHMGLLKVKNLEKYRDPYPVIYNKR